MAEFDPELAHLPAALRWQAWLDRVEAVLFASATPVPRAHLARVVGQGVSVDLLLGDLAAALHHRPYELARTPAGWTLRTRPAHAAAIRAAADVGSSALDLRAPDLALLAAIALHQPVTRDGLKDIFGQEIGRARLTRLQGRGLIANGPRAPRRGAPHSFVTTEDFLTAFGLQSLDALTGAAEDFSPGG